MHVVPWRQSDSVELAKRLRLLPGFVWLDSSAAVHANGRYSFLSALPDDKICVSDPGLQAFEALARLERAPMSTGVLPPELADVSIPHWIGWIAYDAAVESKRTEQGASELIWFGRYPALVCVDHQLERAWVVGETENHCRALVTALDCAAPPVEPPRLEQLAVDAPTDHVEAIQQALELIAAGEIYQVNLARRWTVPCYGNAFALWLAMRSASPVPLGMYLDSGHTEVLACTMERFLRWDRRHNRLECAPIKGTSAQQSSANASALLESPKERAEHTMIVDLIRNDLGRVAVPGSVQLEQPFRVEAFTGLYHLITTVSCRTRDALTLKQVVEATFPPGSVTGAPKIRAQRVIAELEAHPRGIYCGALGFVDRNGGLSLAVAIRTASKTGDLLEYWAGGGITEASDPIAEVAETELKAQVFLSALRQFA